MCVVSALFVLMSQWVNSDRQLVVSCLVLTLNCSLSGDCHPEYGRHQGTITSCVFISFTGTGLLLIQ
jgi:hypothetical protein